MKVFWSKSSVWWMMPGHPVRADKPAEHAEDAVSFGLRKSWRDKRDPACRFNDPPDSGEGGWVFESLRNHQLVDLAGIHTILLKQKWKLMRDYPVHACESDTYAKRWKHSFVSYGKDRQHWRTQLFLPGILTKFRKETEQKVLASRVSVIAVENSALAAESKPEVNDTVVNHCVINRYPTVAVLQLKVEAAKDSQGKTSFSPHKSEAFSILWRNGHVIGGLIVFHGRWLPCSSEGVVLEVDYAWTCDVGSAKEGNTVP